MEPVEVPEPPFADPEAARIVHEDDPLLDNLRKKPPMRKKTWENESIVNNLPCEGGWVFLFGGERRVSIIYHYLLFR